MKANAHIGYGPKILVAIQDGPITRVYTGIVTDGEIQINNDYDEVGLLDDVPAHSVLSGRRVTLNVEFNLQYMGGQMKTWADIKDPEEIAPSRKERS